jgi:type IV pilus assembly protein PilW
MSRSSHRLRRTARGFTLIEIMVSITIGLFLIGGMLVLVQAMKRTNTNQSGMSNLQDNERTAMQLVSDVVQSTGYFVNPLTSSAVAAFPSGAPAAFTFSGQGLVGANAWTPGPDTISVRYQTNGQDNVINCTGNTSSTATPAAPVTWTNQFSITTSGGISYLTCKVWVNGANPTSVLLIPNVTNIQIYYGLTTGQGTATNSVDTYLDAAGVTAGGYWNVVRSVMITLTFLNPMYPQPGQTQYVTFTRVIAVMNKNGVTTT